METGSKYTKSIFFEPTNSKTWDYFSKANKDNHEENYYATKSMKDGDLLLIYVSHNNFHERGIYEIAEVVGDVYINKDPKEKAGRRYVHTKTLKRSGNRPFYNNDEINRITKQRRSAHKIYNYGVYEEIYKLLK